MRGFVTVVFILMVSLTFLTKAIGWQSPSHAQEPEKRRKLRARELGVHVGILPTGENNAITDVSGVSVGHQTLRDNSGACTGVTVVLPHSGNLFRRKVPAAIYVGNGFGKLAGQTQVDELGNIETPIALTNTLSVAACVEALVKYSLKREGNQRVRSVNAVVGETNDGYLNDIRALNVSEPDVLAAIKSARGGPVAEGCVGAGTGTVCFGFKGGIGTASRALPKRLGGYTVGVLVQTNFGGVLTLNGAPVGRELGQFSFDRFAEAKQDGSCMIVVATDAPLSDRNLKRLAKRAISGMARAGSVMSNGSGDYAIAFSTGYGIVDGKPDNDPELIPNSQLNPLFLAAIEATEEAIYNSLFAAVSTTGNQGHHVDAMPVDKTLDILRKYNLLNLNHRLPVVK